MQRFLSNGNGFWGDSLTTAYYNRIYALESLSPGGLHVCAGSPKDCRNADVRGSPNPENIACWYAARQLKADYPTGVNNNGWSFDFLMADFPYTSNSGIPGSIESPSEAEAKLSQYYSTANKVPEIINIIEYANEKAAVGAAYGTFDTTKGRYAIGVHLFPQQYASTAQNPNFYGEEISDYTAEELSKKWCGIGDPTVPAVVGRATAVSPSTALSGTIIAVIVIFSVVFFCICGGFLSIVFRDGGFSMDLRTSFF